MDPDTQVDIHFPPFLTLYKSCRVERHNGTLIVPPSLNPSLPVSSKDVIINPATALSARLYLPNSANPDPSNNNNNLPILIYFHGGAFCIESAFSPTYHHFLDPFASESKLLIVSVNYRLAPENKLPIAYEDSWAAFQWVMSGQDPWISDHGDRSKIFLAGDSAGANIAHNMAVRAAKVGQDIEGMVLVHPYFYKEIVDDGERKWFEGVWRMLSEEEMDEQKHWPMKYAEGEGMAVGTCKRLMVCVAGKDALKERGEDYYEALVRSGFGGEKEFVETQGEDHVFHLLGPQCEDNKGELVKRLVAFFNK